MRYLLTLTMIVSLQMLSNAAWKKHVILPPVKSAPNGVGASDFNGDGHIDVISSFGRRVVVFQGPTWKQHTVHVFEAGLSRSKPGASCIHQCLMDVDSDGDMDFCGSNQTVFWLECPENPFNGKRWTYRTVDDEIAGTHCLITGDVNRDGKPDLIANSFRDKGTKYPNSIVWLEVPKTPTKAKGWIRHVFADKDAPGGSHYMGLGDLNGDGQPDISCGAKGGPGFPGGEWFAWWEQPKDPTKAWKKHLLSAKQPGATNIIPVDLNKDGHMDMFATRGHGQGVLWFKGPKFEAIEIDAEMVGPHCLVVADLDGDGDADAATCGRDANGVAAWYENNGKAKFTKHIIGRDQGSYDIRAVDMDNDSDLDILIAGHSSRNIVWYENPSSTSTKAKSEVTVVVGGLLAEEGGPIRSKLSKLKEPFGIDFDSTGIMTIVELGGGRVHQLTPDGKFRQIAGDGSKSYQGDGGPAKQATFNGMHNVAVTPDGTIYISDSWNHCIRKIDPKTKNISTIAGTGEAGFSGDDGSATKATFNFLMCVTLNASNDKIYVADLRNRRIRVVDLKTGKVHTVAGNGKRGIPKDGAKAIDSPLVDPRAVTVDSKGQVYILERGGQALRMVDTQGRIFTVAGTGKRGYKDGSALEAQFGSPKHVCVDDQDNVYIADDQNKAIRKYDPKSKTVSTVLGRGKIKLSKPHGVCFEKGQLYVVDTGHHRILRVER